METELIIKSIIGLVVILTILIFLLFFEPNRAKKELSKNKEVAQKINNDTNSSSLVNTDLNYLVSILKNKKSDAKKLSEALELIIKHHGSVHQKLGIRPHPDFNIYMDILFTICRHKNTNKDIIIKFDRELTKLNPQYKQEINESITRGLNSRGM